MLGKERESGALLTPLDVQNGLEREARHSGSVVRQTLPTDDGPGDGQPRHAQRHRVAPGGRSCRRHGRRALELRQIVLVLEVFGLGHLSLGLLSQLGGQQIFPARLVQPEINIISSKLKKYSFFSFNF